MIKIKEVDLKDNRGNIIISKGLKVRSKEGLEYTVDRVVKDKSGKIVILLRKPDDPRFEPPSVRSKAPVTDSRERKYIYEHDNIEDFSTEYYSPESESPPNESDLFAVTQQEFEKDYEVK